MKNAHLNQDQSSVEMVSALSKVLSRTGQKTVTISIMRDILTTLARNSKKFIDKQNWRTPTYKITNLWIKNTPEACIMLIELEIFAKTVPYVTIFVPYVTTDLITSP